MGVGVVTVQEIALLMAQVAALVEKAEEVRRFIVQVYRHPFAARVVLPDPQRDAGPWIEVWWTRPPAAIVEESLQLTWAAIDFKFVHAEECDL